MSTDGQPKKPGMDKRDWPGREQGVPPPPTPAQVEEVSNQQGLIADEWAPPGVTIPSRTDTSAPTRPVPEVNTVSPAK